MSTTQASPSPSGCPSLGIVPDDFETLRLLLCTLHSVFHELARSVRSEQE